MIDPQAFGKGNALNRGRCFLAAGAAFFFLTLGFLPGASARERSWEDLNSRLDTLYRQGAYAESEKPAQQAVSYAERQYGKQHPNVAIALNKLVLIELAQGKYLQAESYARRALSIRENVLEGNL